MACILPYEPEFKNDAEEFIYYFVKNKLPNNWVCYFNYKVKMQEFDVLLMVPKKGIFVIEIKGISGKNPIKVKDNSKIIYGRRGNIIPSPLKQADGYRFKFLDLVEDKFQKSPLVFSIVAYPNLSYDEYKSNELNIISAEEQTFLQEDFLSEMNFKNKLFNLYEEIKHLGKDSLDSLLVMDIRRLFEPEECIKQLIEKDDLIDDNEYPYSIFAYSEVADEVFIANTIRKWSKGTKIIFVSNDKDVLDRAKSVAKEEVESLHLTEKNTFSFYDEKDGEMIEKNSIFQLDFYLIDREEKKGRYFTIENGDEKAIEKNLDILKLVDEQTNFNLNQYKIEHAPINTEMMIRAGAGTGKTYSMISRIMFLYYAHKYNAEEFKKKIVMITFTNEAARNMKTRLQDYLQNYYFLTGRFEVLNIIESIEDMNISTIHSLTKKILQKYATKLGLGKEIAIQTGTYDRNLELLNVLDQYINNNLAKDIEILDKTNLSMYNLQKRIRDFIIKLENKNVDILNDEVDFGQPNDMNELSDLIIEVAKTVTKNLRDKFDMRNAVRLSDLIIKLKYLAKEFENEINNEEDKIDYLFVDEFQDTDDTQINLMKSFRKIFGFKFFVVGDIKQCIYRFRGAEKEAFDTLLNGENLNQWREYTITKNYRSDSLLLDRFHEVFMKLGNKGILDYKDGDEKSDRLRGTRSFNTKNDKLFIVEQFNNDEERGEKLVKIIEELKKNLKKGEQVAILVRENKQVEEVRKMCSRQGLYVYTDVGGDLYKIRPTLDLYKLILALQNNRDPVYLYNLFTTSYVQKPIPKNDLLNFKNKKDRILKLFDNNEVIPKWDKYLIRLRTEPIMKVLKDIIRDIKPWENYSNQEQLREERKRRLVYYRRNLEELLEKIIQFSNTDYLSINKIKKNLEVMILTKQEEEQREYVMDTTNEAHVVCMTVHKSKGLEFDTVIMPYCDMELTSARKIGYVDLIIENQNKTNLDMKYKIGYNIKLDKKTPKTHESYLKNDYYKGQSKTEKFYRKEEETRLLYVAMTRAVKNFIYLKNTDSETEDTWQNLIEGV